MGSYRMCVLGFILLSLCASCWSEDSEATPQGDSSRVSQQGTESDAVETERELETETAGGEKSQQQQKLIVAFVPDYPSKITHPGMLANTTHFIMFYASWCSHSEAALPQFKATLQHVVDQNITGLHLGKIEVTQNGDIVKNFKIRSTPTFIMYHRGARYVFDGEATSHDLIDFMQRVMSINLTEVSTARELSGLQRDHPVVFLLVHDGQTDPDWHYAYSIVAQEKGLLAKFAYTTKPDLVQDFDVTKLPTLLVLKDGSAHRFSDSLSTYNIGKWVSRERHPAFPTADEETFRPFLSLALGTKIVILLVHDDPSTQRITEKRLIDTVRKVAESRKVFPQFQFVQLTSVPLAERMLQSIVPEVPYLFVYDPLSRQYYPFQQSEEDGKGVTEAAVKEFCNAVKRGKIEPLGGGRSLGFIIYSWWTRLYAIYQAMATHHPWLSLGALFSLTSVFIFYIVMCVRRPPTSHRPERRGRRTRASAARDKAKRRVAREKQQQQQQNGSVVRRRQRREEEEEEEEEGEEGEEGELSEHDSSHDGSDDSQHRHRS